MFKVRPFEAKTLSWWHSEKENIDFNPPYQRKSGLWSTKDKGYLIDSILNDYDIPKIYIADFTYVDTPLNKKEKSYAIIDGKQRFEAIFDFFEGRIRLDTDFVLAEDNSLKLGELGYKDLKSKYPKIASKFDNFNLSVMSVITDEESKINELFVRLNRSKPLTGAEVRGAMKGVIPPLIKNIADNKFFKHNVRFSTKRKQYHNVAAKLLLTEFRGKFVDTKKIHLDRFVEEGVRSESSDFKHSADKVREILDIMSSTFLKKDMLLRSSGPITLYYSLFRNNLDQKNVIRDFLIKFDKQRQINRLLAQKKQGKADDELLNYDIFIRNPNDSGSLQKCYGILENRFLAYLKK